MKIPSKINICGIIYEIEITKFENKDLLGDYNLKESKIRLSNEVVQNQLESVFLHEILHIVNINSRSDLKETNTTRLANGLYQVLKDNQLLKE